MKKVLLAIAAVATITSCSQSEDFENPGQKAEISFGTIVRNSTRADILTTNSITKFAVSGFKTSENMTSETQLATGFIDNLSVTKGLEDKWSYTGNTLYWPYTGKVQFFASSPAQTLDVSTAAGYPTFKYTVKEVASQEDLVAANLINKDRASGALIFPFQHLLTQVNLSIKGDTPDFTYTVTRVELKDLKDGGVFTFDGTENVGSWSGLTATASSLTHDFTNNNTVVPTVANLEAKTNLEESGKALFMLMPQDASSITLNITYSSVNGSLNGFSGTKTVTLSGNWEKGHNIRYVLKLTSDTTPVTFSAPSVGDWVNDSDSDKTTPAA